MLDAFTSKEMVCFNTRVLDEHLPKAFDVLADIVLEPKFAEDDIAREQSVVLEEIRMTQDNPEDLVHELFTQNFWQPHALGKPILGTPETVSALDRKTLKQSWFQRFLRAEPSRRHRCGTSNPRPDGRPSGRALLGLSGSRRAAAIPEPPPSPIPHITTRTKRELEQVHICLGVSALPLTDHRRFAVSILNNILGGGMSSRLFQNIRERLGIAYAIFSEMNSYRDAGMLSVYAGTSLETAAAAYSLRPRGISPNLRDTPLDRRRTAPRQGSPERRDPARTRGFRLAHEQPGALSHLFRTPLYARGTHRHARGGDR